MELSKELPCALDCCMSYLLFRMLSFIVWGWEDRDYLYLIACSTKFILMQEYQLRNITSNSLIVDLDIILFFLFVSSISK